MPQKRRRLPLLVLAALAVAAAATAAPMQKRETMSAVFHLTPGHTRGSVSRVFVHADVGMESFRLVLPRGLHAELVSRNPVESATGQAPSTMLCTPFRLCHDRGRTALRFCRDSARKTICGYRSEGGAAFQQGRWTLTVHELGSRRLRVSLRVVFVRGPGY